MSGEARGRADHGVGATLRGGEGAVREQQRGEDAVRDVRVRLPFHLRRLAQVDGEVTVEVQGAPTIRAVFDALEARWPMLRGTVRDYATGERRAYLRIFAGGRDLSLEPSDTHLPEEVASGAEPFIVLGAIAGG